MNNFKYIKLGVLITTLSLAGSLLMPAMMTLNYLYLIQINTKIMAFMATLKMQEEQGNYQQLKFSVTKLLRLKSIFS